MPPAKLADGDTRRLNLIAPNLLMERADEWRGQQPGVPSLSAAIRQLLEFGLDNPAAHHKARRPRDKARAA